MLRISDYGNFISRISYTEPIYQTSRLKPLFPKKALETCRSPVKKTFTHKSTQTDNGKSTTSITRNRTIFPRCGLVLPKPMDRVVSPKTKNKVG